MAPSRAWTFTHLSNDSGPKGRARPSTSCTSFRHVRAAPARGCGSEPTLRPSRPFLARSAGAAAEGRVPRRGGPLASRGSAALLRTEDRVPRPRGPRCSPGGLRPSGSALEVLSPLGPGARGGGARSFAWKRAVVRRQERGPRGGGPRAFPTSRAVLHAGDNELPRGGPRGHPKKLRNSSCRLRKNALLANQ